MEEADEEIRIAAGYCFTQEGLAILAAQNFQVLSYYTGDWTDASYQGIFQIRLSELGGKQVRGSDLPP